MDIVATSCEGGELADNMANNKVKSWLTSGKKEKVRQKQCRYIYLKKNVVEYPQLAHTATQGHLQMIAPDTISQ